MSGAGEGLLFKPEWETAGGVRSPELAATWCRLEIWVDDHCVTHVEETDNASTRRSIFVPLYPLAEWAAYNWWFLYAHSRPAAFPERIWTYDTLMARRTQEYDWLRHHNLRGAGEGYPWPDLTIVSEGEFSLLAWSSSRPRARGGLRYLASGQALLRAGDVRSALRTLIESTITRLDEQGVIKSALHEEWSAVVQLDAEEQAFAEAAARLGLDPFDTPDGTADALQWAGKVLEGDLLSDFLDAVAVFDLEPSLAWVTKSLGDFGSLAAPAERALLQSLGPVARRMKEQRWGQDPWHVGLAQARAVRQELQLEPTAHFDIDSFVSSRVRPLSLRGLDAVGDDKDGIRLMLSRRGPRPDRRFAGARALWHALNHESAAPFLLTDARAYRQKVERAFAAELLAPTAGIAALTGGPATSVDAQTVDRIARHFDVRALLIDHQIENNVLAGV